MFLTHFNLIVYVFATIYKFVNVLWGKRSNSLCMLYSRKKPLNITFFGSEAWAVWPDFVQSATGSASGFITKLLQLLLFCCIWLHFNERSFWYYVCQWSSIDCIIFCWCQFNCVLLEWVKLSCAKLMWITFVDNVDNGDKFSMLTFQHYIVSNTTYNSHIDYMSYCAICATSGRTWRGIRLFSERLFDIALLAEV